ncbi:hypothetical protein ABFA07_010885 [Porites harrisoni]
MDLTAPIQQHGNNTELYSFYHKPNGDPKPEDQWPSEDFWKKFYPKLFPDLSPGLKHEQALNLPSSTSKVLNEPGSSQGSSGIKQKAGQKRKM